MSTPFYDLASLVLVPSGYKAQKVYAQKPLTTDGQLTFSRASTATRVNSAGLIETVSSNVPRLDYLNSSCPRLLLEPQRTNLVFFSEQLNNAGWAAGAVVTANTAVSPDGYTNADSVMEAGINDFQILGDPVATTSGTAYTFSFFAKPNGRNFARILFGNGSFPDDEFAYFNLLTGAITKSTLVEASMVSYPNGWYRCIATLTSNANATDAIYFGPARNMTDGYAPYTGNTSVGIYVWGVQQEAGAYATSYIPTLGAAVTRGADAASKTGISSLIGQTEGTLFVEGTYQATNTQYTRFIALKGSGTTYQSLLFFQDLQNGDFNLAINDASGSSVCSITFTHGLSDGATYKIAISYAANDVVIYMNGTNRGADTSYTPVAFSDFYLQYTDVLGKTQTKQALLFKTRLPNAQLAELTSL